LREKILLMTILALLVSFAPLHYVLANSLSNTQTNALGRPQFHVGDYWTESGQARYSTKGSGSLYGSYEEDDSYTVQYTVLKIDGDLMDLTRTSHGTWTSTASGTWVSCCNNGKTTDSGTYSRSYTYTIRLSTLNVVDSTASKDYVGNPFLYMINPQTLVPGGTARQGYWVPSSDAKSWTWTMESYAVGQDTLRFNGVNLKVLTLTYTGPDTGYFSWDKSYSTGQATYTYTYDTIYGVDVGFKGTGTYSKSNVGGGGWTEEYSESYQLSDTNLSFKVTYTLDADPSSAAVTVDGRSYSGGGLPQVFVWDYGTTHILTVNATVQGAAGVRYIFFQWSDGQKDLTRTVTATESASLKAIYRTQYELKVLSEFGTPTGSGWYDSGSTATFSVTSPSTPSGIMGILGGRMVFHSWSGDSSASTPAATLTMDSPKTVVAQWTADNTVPMVVVAVIAAAILVAAFIMMRRRRKSSPATSLYDRPATVQVSGTRFCASCGAELPPAASFCSKCGTQQS